MKILVVDDDHDLAESFKELLEFEGHEVVVRFICESGLTALDESDFDRVFLDVRLPGIDGVETLKQIRSRGKAVRVIMMTGFDLAGLVQSANENGVTCILQKPLDVEQILAKLR